MSSTNKKEEIEGKKEINVAHADKTQEEEERSTINHILLITYEFTYSPFSGNGILARSLVKSLLLCHDKCQITVWCCRPYNTTSKNVPLEFPEISQTTQSRLDVQSTVVKSSWGRLDDQSSWKEFTWNHLNDTAKSRLSQILSLEQPFQKSTTTTTTTTMAVSPVDMVCFVDWTGFHAWDSIPVTKTDVPLVNLNFRVYSSGVSDPIKRQWYDEMESRALQKSKLVIALSEKDKLSLLSLLKKKEQHQQALASSLRPAQEVKVLLPPLRADIETIAKQFQHQPTSSSGDNNNPMKHISYHQQEFLHRYLSVKDVEAIQIHPEEKSEKGTRFQKCFLICVVRLSPEKETMRFVHFIEQLLLELNNSCSSSSAHFIPLLVAGSGSDPAYAKAVKQEFIRVCKSNNTNYVIVEEFLPPIQLSTIFSLSLLNFHPCQYDAYGMTIMEAAAFAVPSIIASGNTVGASAILGNNKNDNSADIAPACVEIDMSPLQQGKEQHDTPSTADNSENNYKNNRIHNKENHCTNNNDTISQKSIQHILDLLLNKDHQKQPNQNQQMQLSKIGQEARRRALAWDELAYGKKLLQYLSLVKQQQH